MRVKTSKTTDKQINWLVATIDKIGCYPPRMYNWMIIPADGSADFYSPATDWAQGGPIIEREHISIRQWENVAEVHAYTPGGVWSSGSTPLIAAMRSYVASKLGDEVEIPEELK